jgi:hypothetical protein
VGNLLVVCHPMQKWLCIVKWQDFDAKYNSLVQFSDLNKESQEYVTDMHDIIFTERKS